MRLTRGNLRTKSSSVSDSDIWCVVRMILGVEVAASAPLFYIRSAGHIASINLISATLFNALEIFYAIVNSPERIPN